MEEPRESVWPPDLLREGPGTDVLNEKWHVQDGNYLYQAEVIVKNINFSQGLSHHPPKFTLQMTIPYCVVDYFLLSKEVVDPCDSQQIWLDVLSQSYD